MRLLSVGTIRGVRRLSAGLVVVAVSVGLAACGGGDSDEHAGHEHLDHFTEEPGYTVTNPDDAVPYPERLRYLEGQSAEQVSTEALRLLTEFTSTAYDKGTVVDPLNGLTTTPLWGELTADPTSHVMTLTGPTWRAWDQAGGPQRVDISVVNEQHPEDTDTSWTRKFSVVHHLDGISRPITDTYIVGVEKTAGKWFVDDLRLLSTT